MLGIGGNLYGSSSQRPPHAEKHTKTVLRLRSSGVGNRIRDGDDMGHVPYASDDNAKDKDPKVKLPSKKRKRKRSGDSEKDKEKLESKHTNLAEGWIHMSDVIFEAKKKLQSGEQKNGVTFAFIGSSGCGKSTMIRKIFLDDLFTERAKREEKKEFVIVVFTESSKSDAFKDLDKNILVDGKGLDEDTINWCYHMNEKYDKKYNFFIIFDDVLDIQYKKLVKRMFLIMRNTNISSLVSLQYPNLIPKAVRTSVYFTILFHFNTDEGVELAIKGWLSAYIPGKNVREKMVFYRKWTTQGEGHQMFLVDNLNQKCYLVRSDYYCKELPMITCLPKTTSEKRESTNEISINDDDDV